MHTASVKLIGFWSYGKNERAISVSRFLV